MCVVALGGGMFECSFFGFLNETVLLRQLGVPGEPQTAANKNKFFTKQYVLLEF
jgi:hypothetical protein